MTTETVKKPHANKGKKRTPEQCARIAAATKKAMASKKVKENMEKGLKEYYAKPGVREKISERVKKYYRDTPGAIQKNKDAQQKYWNENPEAKIEMSKIKKKQYDEHPELKEKLSEIHIKRHKENPEIGRRHSDIMKKLFEDPAFRQRSRDTKNKYYEDPESRKKISDAMLKFHEEHPEWADEQSKRITEVHKNNPHLAEEHSEAMKEFYIENPDKHPFYIRFQKGYISSLEKIMMEILDSLNIEYIHNHPQIGYFIDFAIIDKKIAMQKKLKNNFLYKVIDFNGLCTNPLSSKLIKSSLITFLRIFKLPFISALTKPLEYLNNPLLIRLPI